MGWPPWPVPSPAQLAGATKAGLRWAATRFWWLLMVSRLMGCRHRTATSPSRLFAGRGSGGGFIRSGAGPSGAAAVLLPLSWVKGSNVAVSPQINWEPLLNGGKEDGEWTPAFGVHWTGAVAAGNEWLLPPRPYATCGASRHNPFPRQFWVRVQGAFGPAPLPRLKNGN